MVVGPDGAAWVTEGGQNAIARVDPKDHRVQLWQLTGGPSPTPTSTRWSSTSAARYWFTGQGGVIGRFEPTTEQMEVWDAPRGRGPYGIACTPQGTVWYVSLAGNYLPQIEICDTGRAAHRRAADAAPGRAPRLVRQPGPAVDQRMEQRQRLHARSAGRKLEELELPGERPRCYSVYVDDRDKVWLTDFSANAIVRFDPRTETLPLLPVGHVRAPTCARWPDGRARPGAGKAGTNRIVVIDKPRA